MITVALHTATDRLSVAVRGPSGASEVRTADGPRIHGKGILSLLDQTLEAIGADRAMIGEVRVADGPGSFTGLRVGASVAKALLAGTGHPLRVASLLLLDAWHLARSRRRTGAFRVLAVRSALRGELYAGGYRFGPGDEFAVLTSPAVTTAAALLRDPVCDGLTGAGAFVNSIGGTGLGKRGERWSAVESVVEGEGDAADLLELDRVPGALLTVDDPSVWEPQYGRPAEAQVRWEERHGRPFPHP